MQRFLFYLGHPAHFHNLKHSINLLITRGNKVLVVGRGKDVLFDLIDTEDWEVIKLPERKVGGKLTLITSLLKRELTMFGIARKFRPHLMAGTDLVIAHVGKLLGITSLIINEDDSAAIPLMAKYGFPYATAILAPNCCDQSPSNDKKIGYEGYHELAYLHPDYFEPDNKAAAALLSYDGPYFILRFASLHAHHDAGKQGISDDLAFDLIKMLEPYGRIFITSERPFSELLEPYRLKVHPKDMHLLLASAELYIGDSQTMAAEAAVLGVPSIRFNDFIGELSYLNELEDKYQLTWGIRTSQPDLLLDKIRTLLADKEIKLKMNQRRRYLLENTISVTPFWVETFNSLATLKG